MLDGICSSRSQIEKKLTARRQSLLTRSRKGVTRGACKGSMAGVEWIWRDVEENGTRDRLMICWVG